MPGKVWGEEYRTTLVCVDSFAHGELRGRFYHPGNPTGVAFLSLTQFLQEMERLLDAISFPDSFQTLRTFSDHSTETELPREIHYQPGKMATFALRILFRQNASWQGTVVWQEGRREQTFRSVLELILLMSSALEFSEAV